MKSVKDFIHCITMLFAGLLCCVSVYSQNPPTLPQVIPPSPMASQFARYGEIPIGHTTGVPQIEIPIYTLSTGWIDVPIGISYHASGFRPSDVASPVGLGWVLNAGGCISRTIEGQADYRLGKEPLYNSPVKSVAAFDSIKYGLIYVDNKNLSDIYNVDYWESSFTRWPDAKYDTRSDRYSYNFLSNIGMGRYDLNDYHRKLKTIPFSPLDFNYFPAEEKFSVCDSKGVVYEFSEPDTVFISGTYSVTTGWFLTKIYSQNNDSIEFTYIRGKSYQTIEYTQSAIYYDNQYVAKPSQAEEQIMPSGLINSPAISRYCYYKTPLIKTIRWRNLVISFNYMTDRADQQKERLCCIQITSGSHIVKTIEFNNTNSYFGNLPHNKRLKLNGIHHAEANETYTFDYYHSNNDLILPDYYGSKNGVCCVEDYWGYWNDTESLYTFPSSIAAIWEALISHCKIPSTNRNANETYTKACVLKSITYPTKGKTLFEYEINKATIGGTSMNLTGQTAGGLRVKKITNYSDNTQTISNCKEYKYEGRSLMPLRCSLEMYYHYSAFFLDEYRISNFPYCIPYSVHHFTATPLSSYCTPHTPSVFYEKVYEYNGTLENNDGWTLYLYTQSNRSVHSPVNMNLLNTFNDDVDNDHGSVRGIYLGRKVYDKHSLLRNQQTNVYKIGTLEFPTGMRISITVETDRTLAGISRAASQLSFRDGILDHILAYNTSGFQDYELLTQTVNSFYENDDTIYEEKISYDYDFSPNGLPILLSPSTVTHINSNGKLYSQKTIYPYSANYKNAYPYYLMKEKHMLDYPVEKQQQVDGITTEVVKTEYRQTGNLILPSDIWASKNGSTPKKRISYQRYDTKGNPVYLIKDDTEQVVYLWSYNYQYPVFKIQGASYAQVKAALSYSDAQLESLAATSSPSLNGIESMLRTNLPKNVFITSYRYKPGVGISSVSEPGKATVYYGYDEGGRLIETYIMENGNKLKLNNNAYNYK